ncbi:hypothetical protein A2U01_0030471 [Trifolium medium]|uniref:Uncharacterized protein n=1 Tax=Trifolium medium TaxID=97028 RepID=A0A392PEU0_9FABA|nr:hypothetical protein [Trifolium medium]
MFSSFEKLLNRNQDNVIRSPEKGDAISEPVNPEVEASPEAVEISSEKTTSEQQTLKQTSEQTPPDQITYEPIPPQDPETITEPNTDQISEQVVENTVVLNDSDFDSATKSENFPTTPPVTNPELVRICNSILLRMRKLHKLRYSYTEPYQYMEMWESLRNGINKDLDRI